MKKILLVEDSAVVIKVIRHMSKGQVDLQFDIAQSFSEARAFIESNGRDAYRTAVVDLNLPDAPNGEVVDYALSLSIPTIVLTGSFDEHLRDQMLEKPIVDYVVKESRFSYEYVLKLIRRLEKNRRIKVLVVDDSPTSRKFVRIMLEIHQYIALEAENGEQALNMLNQDPSIKVAIIDYNMPVMNGFELIKNIRRDVSKNNLILIGLSAHGTRGMSAKFIKNGANDFLAKPFSHEEFYCRMMHNIEAIELLESIEHAAYHDYLTDVHNRRYFYDHSSLMLADAQAKCIPVCVALLDVDYFKAINDQFGHEAGDLALIEVSRLMEKAFGRFLFARVGGEEFAVLMSGLNLEKAEMLAENIREMVEDSIILLEGTSTSVTVSIGLVADQQHSLDELVNEADKLLYIAKDLGRNRIEVSTC
jgi:diguanylate cyclase (GGDEF)-like protein